MPADEMDRALQGIATDLLRLVVSHAVAQTARAVYLHVVSYNAGAIAFYRRNAFEEVSLLRDFYYIACAGWTSLS